MHQTAGDDATVTEIPNFQAIIPGNRIHNGLNFAMNKIFGRGEAVENGRRGFGGLIGGNGERNPLSVPIPSSLPEKES